MVSGYVDVKVFGRPASSSSDHITLVVYRWLRTGSMVQFYMSFCQFHTITAVRQLGMHSNYVKDIIQG